MALPLSWMAAYYLIPGFSDWWYKTSPWTGGALLALWPSSILFLGDPGESDVGLRIITTALNVALYGSLGALLWIGLRRSKIVLAVTALSVLVGWYSLLSL